MYVQPTLTNEDGKECKRCICSGTLPLKSIGSILEIVLATSRLQSTFPEPNDGREPWDVQDETSTNVFRIFLRISCSHASFLGLWIDSDSLSISSVNFTKGTHQEQFERMDNRILLVIPQQVP